MKKNSEPTLEELKKQVQTLKKRKEEKMAYAQTMQERMKLQQEINQLEETMKSPSKLKSFGKTFGRGLSIVGKKIWKGISTASRNLNKNAPEFREFGRGMQSQRPMRQMNQMSPFNPVTQGLFLPSAGQDSRVRVPKKTKSPLMKKTKTKKSKSKRKSNKKMKARPRRSTPVQRVPQRSPMMPFDLA